MCDRMQRLTICATGFEDDAVMVHESTRPRQLLTPLKRRNIMGNSKKPYDPVKRVIDIIGSGTALIVLSLVIGAVGLAVRWRLGSPVIFKQQRPGKDGKIFTIYKFRSMLDDDESCGFIHNEDRIVSFGQKLGSTSLDELPSLWNVLQRDMSLVGRRPLHSRY